MGSRLGEKALYVHADVSNDESVEALVQSTVSATGEITGEWSAGEVSQFADLLRRFNEAIEQRGAATWPRKD